jgi:hypothetical protein
MVKKAKRKTKRVKKKVAARTVRKKRTRRRRGGVRKARWKPPMGKELEQLRKDWDHCT